MVIKFCAMFQSQRYILANIVDSIYFTKQAYNLIILVMKENTRYKTVQHFHSSSKQQEYRQRSSELDHKRKYLTPDLKLKNKRTCDSLYRPSAEKDKLKERQIISKILNFDVQYQEDPVLKQEIKKKFVLMQEQQQQESYNSNKDYLIECQNIRKYKQQFYQKMRSRLVKKFPLMKKVYQQKNIQVSQYIQPIKIDSLQLPLSPKKSQSSNRNSRVSSLQNQKSWIRLTIQNHLKQIPQKRNRLNTQQANKKSYFYSKSKKRCMTAFNPYKEVEQQEKPQQYSDFNYLDYTKNRNVFKKSTKIKDCGPMHKASKVRRLLKSQVPILNIQKQGTHEYQILKKSFQQSVQRQL